MERRSGRDEDGEKKSREKRGRREGDTNSRDRLMLAERKAERKKLFPERKGITGECSGNEA